jgi:hypothetical protein
MPSGERSAHRVSHTQPTARRGGELSQLTAAHSALSLSQLNSQLT